MKVLEKTDAQLVPSTPFFALVRTSNSPSRPTMYLVYREQEPGKDPEWIGTGSTFAHAKAISDRMNLHLQSIVVDFLRSVKIHPEIAPSSSHPVYIVREKVDAPLASIPLRVVFDEQIDVRNFDVLYSVVDIQQFHQF